MMNKSTANQITSALLVLGCIMLAFALYNPPMLALLGFSIATISIGIAHLCYRMWTKIVDRAYHEREAYVSEIAFACTSNLVRIKFWCKWKWHACSLFPQFWAMFIWIMYCGFISFVSMYVETLPAPCDLRNDCASVQARGIYTGEEK